LPDAQSVSALQLVLHVVLLAQTYWPQVVGVAVPQVPLPVQVGAGV
jgi:hypothetical protein